MTTPKTLNNDDIANELKDIKDVVYFASRSGEGDFYLVTENGEVVIEVEEYFGNISMQDVSFCSDVIEGKHYWVKLDEINKTFVMDYIAEHKIFDKYMEEVAEKACKSQ